jgi:predicted DNA-binding antitoxin AbrB/MazE fold protein
MSVQVDAVYQNGILRPLQPLHLPENERVVVTVSPAAQALGFGQGDTEYLEGLRRKPIGAEPAPGLEDVRRRLSKIPGSMAPDFAAEREDS